MVVFVAQMHAMFVAQVVVTFRQHPMRLGHKSSQPRHHGLAFGPHLAGLQWRLC